MKKHPLIALLFLTLCISVFGADAKYDPTKWEKDIAVFEEKDRIAPPPKDAILFIGSSHVRRWVTLSEDFQGQKIINRGFGGSDIRDATLFAERIIFPYAPKRIYLRAGSNEIWNERRTPDETFEDYKNFITVVRKKLPEVDIIFISNFRSIARVSKANQELRLNMLISEYVRDKSHLGFIDVFNIAADENGALRPECFVEDKLHLTPIGYKLLAEKVRPDLVK